MFSSNLKEAVKYTVQGYYGIKIRRRKNHRLDMEDALDEEIGEDRWEAGRPEVFQDGSNVMN